MINTGGITAILVQSAIGGGGTPIAGSATAPCPTCSSRSSGEAAWKEVAAHSDCWAKVGPPVSEGRRAATTDALTGQKTLLS
ncbi:hypothetical protein GCM10010339_90560 [Streptomyces alanosinicus]|uniref:Uncharacterized protein n=1 Tax=Streptomyces alanosinicus TaxID=68171 RepID=A0A919D6Y5_9ACTN|nr:hypothetical protein GCM10010339_90560 [Streptomyces alanosinicus]